MFDRYLKRWNLTRDGVPIVTHSSDLLPVQQDGRLAMLKIAREAEERRGAGLMTWWDGAGAARVLAHDGDAVLLERATGHRSLKDVVHDGADDEASRILCDVAARLHAPRNRPLPDLIPLSAWFAELEPAAARHGGILARAAEAARGLLNDPRETAVLHGDLHHGNVLDFDERGWLAIDPASADSISPTSSATRISKLRRCPAAWRAKQASSPRWRASIAHDCCVGYWPMPDCPPRGPPAKAAMRGWL
jgi:streptomycin 6-kinase